MAPGAGAIQHAIADKATMHGFVAAAAAGDDRHLTAHRRLPPHDVVGVKVNGNQLWVRQCHPLQLFIEYVVDNVD